MKRTSLVHILSIGVLALQGVILQAKLVFSQPRNSGFWCDLSMGIPTTVYQNPKGGKEAWIRWTSDYFSGSGYDPRRRCQIVSDRLETYRRAQQLKYITVGQMNRQNVICTASQYNGPCEGLIYTLRFNQDPRQTLQQFLAWGVEIGSLPSEMESGGSIYIDLRPKLGDN